MESQVKVSVLIPAYNVEPYIDQCLESVMNQTLREIEIIVTDDGSTDNTLAHIEAAAQKDARIRIIRHMENRGLFQTRKDAVFAARGEHIMFVDSDDYLEPNACELAYEKAKEADADVLQFGVFVDNCGNVPNNRIKNMQKGQLPYMGPPLTEPLVKACFKEKKFSASLIGKTFKTATIMHAYSKMEDGYYYAAEDVLQIFFILMESDTYCGIEERLYHYCYGRGIFGHERITPEGFAELCRSADVCLALDRRIGELESRTHGDTEETVRVAAGREAVTEIRARFMREDVSRWLNDIRKENRAAAFLTLEAAWEKQMTPAGFVGLLAKCSWGKREAIAGALSGAEYLRFEGRQIRNVALYYRKARNGGAERVVTMLCSMLAERRDENGNAQYHVVLITEEPPNEEDYPLSPLVERECIPSYQESGGAAYPSRAEAWGRIVTKYSLDAVLYSQHTIAQLMWDLLSIKRTPQNPAFVIHAQNWFAAMYKGAGMSERRQTYRLADAVVTLTEADRLYWSPINHRARCILNPCFAKPDETQRAAYRKHILWIGRVNAVKQPMELIAIMREAVAQDPEIVLHVVGDDDAALRQRLEESIRAEGLAKNVVMEGFHPDVTPFYRQCSLLLITSRSEGGPLIAYEAAAFGLPTVMYAMPWLPYCTEMEGWISVPQLDAAAAAEAVVRIVNDPIEWQARSDALYRSALRYEKKDILAEWLALFSELEHGSEPEYPVPDETTQIMLEQITYFHKAALKSLTDKAAKGQKANELLETQLESAKQEASRASAQNRALQKKLDQAMDKIAALKTKLDETNRDKVKALERVKDIESSRAYRLACKMSAPFTGGSNNA